MSPTQFHPRAGARAFSLIEMIGVLAVMAILATTILPSSLRSIDRAAVKAEAQTVHALGEAVKQSLRSTGALPTAANWATAVAGFVDLGSNDIAANKRQMNRVYLVDPAAPSQRVLILSSMRSLVAVPTTANAAQFAVIWNTPEGVVPATTGGAAWANWSNLHDVPNSVDYLVIERVNVAPIYATDLQSLTLTFNNKSGIATSYNLVLADGTTQSAVTIPAGATAVLAGRRPRDRANLYRAAGGVSLDYTYVLSTTGKTIDFNGTTWLPQ